MTEALDQRQLIEGMSAAFARFQPRFWQPLPHQVPPTGDWEGWLMLAGRGAGKTDALAHYVVEHARGPACINGPAPHWIGLVAPDKQDAATSGFFGPAGIRAHDPSAKLVTRAGGTVVIWPNGSECKLFGARHTDDIEALRAGGNRCLIWFEELAAMRYMSDAFDQAMFGLRAGPNPRWVASTTPKPRQLIKDLHEGKYPKVALTTGIATADNPYLPEHIRFALEQRYGATTLGAQELHGRIVEEDENALWHRGDIERFRLNPDEVPRESLKRVTVGVDPSGGAGEQGIVVVGKGPHDGGVWAPVLDDRTCRLSPEGWGKRAVTAAMDWDADDIVVEVNFGGDMAVATVRSAADALGVPIPIRKVRASLAKRVRAEPVSAISARGLVPHAGVFPELEDQMCFPAGTLVETARGHISIEEVTDADWVMTRAGWAPLVWAGLTGVSDELVTVTHVHGCVVSTAWHPIWTESRGYVPAVNVRRTDRLAVRPSPVSTAHRWLGEAAGGTGWPAGIIGTPRDNYCTARSGRCIEGRSQRASTSTTGITTPAITGSAILCYSHRSSTRHITVSAGRSRSTALLDRPAAVRSGHVGSPTEWSAVCAAASFGQPGNALSSAHGVVVDASTTAVPVYDLTVAPGYPPEFYANGALVHNCTWVPGESDYSPDRLDAMVWGVTHLGMVPAVGGGKATWGGASMATRSVATLRPR